MLPTRARISPPPTRGRCFREPRGRPRAVRAPTTRRGTTEKRLLSTTKRRQTYPDQGSGLPWFLGEPCATYSLTSTQKARLPSQRARHPRRAFRRLLPHIFEGADTRS